MCKKCINHENYDITAIPKFSGEDVVEEVRMVSIKDLALVEVWFKLAQVLQGMHSNQPQKNWKKEAKNFRPAPFCPEWQRGLLKNNWKI